MLLISNKSERKVSLVICREFSGRRRFEILCSSSMNNFSRLRAANEWYMVLSRNSMEIFRSNRVFFQVLSLSYCLENAGIYIFVAYLSLQKPLFQATNKPSSFSKVWKVGIVTSLLTTTTRVIRKVGHSVPTGWPPWGSDIIDSGSVLVSTINALVQLIFSVPFFYTSNLVQTVSFATIGGSL